VLTALENYDGAFDDFKKAQDILDSGKSRKGLTETNIKFVKDQLQHMFFLSEKAKKIKHVLPTLDQNDPKVKELVKKFDELSKQHREMVMDLENPEDDVGSAKLQTLSDEFKSLEEQINHLELKEN